MGFVKTAILTVAQAITLVVVCVGFWGVVMDDLEGLALLLIAPIALVLGHSLFTPTRSKASDTE